MAQGLSLRFFYRVSEVKTTIDSSGKYSTKDTYMEAVIEQPKRSLTQQAIAELSTFNEMISTVIPYGEFTVAEDGIGKVEEAHKAVKKLNAAIEKKRKDLKAASLEYGRTVDSIAKQLTEKVDSVESKLKAERDAFDAVEKAEKAAKEAEKVAKKQGRVNEMVAAGIVIDWTAAELPDDEWMWWLSKAKKAAAEILEEKRQAEAFAEQQRKEREELASRIARMEALGVAVGSAERVGQLSAEQFEFDYQVAKKAVEDRKQAIEAEQKRQAEELRIRAEEIEKQRKADETAMAEERARLKAEREAADARQAEERKAMEAKWEAIRQQQEELRKAEEAKAIAEREAAEAARLEALKPEIEKAQSFAECMLTDAQDSLTRLGNPSWGEDALHAIRNCGALIVAMVIK